MIPFPTLKEFDRNTNKQDSFTVVVLYVSCTACISAVLSIIRKAVNMQILRPNFGDSILAKLCSQVLKIALQR